MSRCSWLCRCWHRWCSRPRSCRIDPRQLDVCQRIHCGPNCRRVVNTVRVGRGRNRASRPRVGRGRSSDRSSAWQEARLDSCPEPHRNAITRCQGPDRKIASARVNRSEVSGRATVARVRDHARVDARNRDGGCCRACEGFGHLHILGVGRPSIILRGDRINHVIPRIKFGTSTAGGIGCVETTPARQRGCRPLC